MKGYYSLIQFCPDLSRAEAANVGVLLFCPEVHFVKAITTTSNDRIRRFFKEYSCDLERINAAKQSIEGRVRTCAAQIKSLEDLEIFIATRANEIQISAPRPVKVLDPETELQQLFRELVGGRQRGNTPPKDAVQRLERLFQDNRFKGRVEFSKQIRLPVVDRQMVVPFAYRNGVLNLIQPIALSGIASRATNSALQRVSEGELIERHPVEGQSAKLIVVYSFNAGATDPILAARIKSIFDDFKIKSVSDTGIDAFADEVNREAH